MGREDEKFYHGWTVFYWAWWISWSPFVGMFIARVAKWRTVREFLIAVLLVPTRITMIWMTAFGSRALDEIQANVGQLTHGISDVSLAMFQMGGGYWQQWRKGLVSVLTANQNNGGCEDGSWDPTTNYSCQRGGRLFTTAMACLSMQVHYRYRRVSEMR